MDQRRSDPLEDLEEVLFEFLPLGNSVKVCALDPRTNTEVSIVGPATASTYVLKMTAARKLHRQLVKAGHLPAR